jgi:peptidoglycan/LPS O-acetylase OafA/YrhL
MSETVQRYYVPQLDGLRFFAFLLVFVHHFMPAAESFTNFEFLVPFITVLQNYGWAGVDLFLVLSAFLITNLLLLEQQRTGTISLKDFYIRRSLRIWPLYYLMILIGFFINPIVSGKFTAPDHQKLMAEHFLPYVAFLGNYSAGMHNYAESRFLAHLWTISLEEQFYILWPVLLVLLVSKRRLLAGVLLGLLGFSVMLRFYFLMEQAAHPQIWTNLFTRLDPLVLGTLLALYRSRNPATGRGDGLKYLGGISLVVLPTFFPNIDTHSIHVVWQYLSIALGFCLLLDASLAGTVRLPHLVLTGKPIVWLGKLCYGLYIYHLIGINIGKKLQRSLHLYPGSEMTWLVTFIMAMVVTVLLSYVSYNFFEKKFLKLKNRFTIVQSRPA